MTYDTQTQYPGLTNPWVHYHELSIIQKINVKANVRGYASKHLGISNNPVVYVAANDLKTFQYDSPFYFTGPNPRY